MKRILLIILFTLVFMFPLGLIANPGSAQATITVKEYTDKMLDERCKLIEQRFIEIEKAINLARTEMERRLSNLNELRNEVNQDRNQFVTREYFDVKIGPLEKSITQVETQLITWMMALGAFVIILNLGLHYWSIKNSTSRKCVDEDGKTVAGH